MKKFRKIAALLLGGIITASVIAGCTSTADIGAPAPEAAAPAQEAAAPEAEEAAAPAEAAADADKYGGTMVLGTRFDVIQPNFVFYSSNTEGLLRDLIYDKLFTVDQDLNVIPRLATGYEANEDNTSFIVHLRDDVKWADGEDFTADDIVCYFYVYDNVETTLKDNTWAEDYGLVVTKIDDYTVQYDLDRPCNTFVYSDLCQYVALPEHIWKDAPLDAFDEITDLKYLTGMGPFVITELKQGEEIVLKRNDNYWEMKPYLDGVTVRIIPDADSLSLAFENGDIDMYRCNADIYNRLQGEDGFSFHAGNSGNMTYILLDYDDEILQDVEVRHALSLLTDRESMKIAAKSPQSSVMTSVFTTADIGYAPNTMVEDGYTYDPDKAIQILDEAGWVLGDDGIREKDGQKLTIEILSTADATASQLVWMDSLKSAGIDVSVKIVDTATRNSLVFTNDPHYQVFFNGSTMGPTCDGYITFYGSGMYNSYYSEENQAMFAEATAAPTLEESTDIYSKISEKVSSEYPCIWLYENVRYWGMGNGLKTDDCSLTGYYCGWVSIAHAYFEK